MKTYFKLVRDKIPSIIQETGKTCTTKTLSSDEYLEALQAKLGEEFKEYLEAPDEGAAMEELADMLEVVHALAKALGAQEGELEQIRERKREDRGAFDHRLLLLEVQD